MGNNNVASRRAPPLPGSAPSASSAASPAAAFAFGDSSPPPFLRGRAAGATFAVFEEKGVAVVEQAGEFLEERKIYFFPAVASEEARTLEALLHVAGGGRSSQPLFALYLT